MKSFEISALTTPTLTSNSIFARLHDTIPYLIAGILFVFGSYQYLPSISNFEIGGWMFTLGSVSFLYGDLNEWLKLHRVEWFHEILHKEDISKTISDLGGVVEVTCYSQFQLSSNYWNSLLSVFGSILYLIGSVMFIPQLHVLVLGTIMYILASFVIFLSQMFKLYRAGCRSPSPGTPTLPVSVVTADEATMKSSYFNANNFQLRHLIEDLPAVGADLTAGMGGFAYMIGSYLFLPNVAVTEMDITHATAWFIIGGGLFLISGMLLVCYSASCTCDSADVRSIANSSTPTPPTSTTTSTDAVVVIV